MILDELKFALGLCVVLCVEGAGASYVRVNYMYLQSMPIEWTVALAGVCLAVVSVFAMACCGFFKGRSKANDDPEIVAETGNALNVTGGNDIRMSHQTGPHTDVAAKPMQTTSFNLQSEIVRVESNGPQRPNASAAVALGGGQAVAAPQETKEFKDRSTSLASLRTIGNEAVEAVTLFSKDNSGIGLTVNGGTDNGIFVKDIQPDGPAGESRRLNSGDRIVSMAICMEKMTLDHAQTLIQLARLYPVELHFVKGSPEVVVHPISSETVQSPVDLLEERGRSQSAGCLPSVDEDLETKLHQDRPSSSLTNLPLPGQISRWSNEDELSPEIKFQNNGSTFEADVHAMSDLTSAQITGDEDDEELAAITAKHRMNSIDSSESGKHPGEHEPSVAGAGLFAEYEAPDGNSQNQRANAASDVDSEDEEDADRVNRIGGENAMINKGGQPRVHGGGEGSLAEPTWQSDFKIDLPHMDVDSAPEGSRASTGSPEVKGFAVTSAFQSDESFEGTHQNNRDIFKRGKGGFDRDSSTHWSSSYDTEYDEEKNSDEKTANISFSNARTSEGISWNANSPDLNSEVERDVEVDPSPLSTKIDVDRRAQSFGVKAERGKESYSDQGQGSTEEETSDGEVKLFQTGVAVDAGANAKSDLLDPPRDFGSPVHGGNTDEHGFDDMKASANWGGGNISGSKGLRRSPEGKGDHEEVKVVRQGQTDSYYERFCETVDTGLPGRVIDLDVVDEGPEKEEEEHTGSDAELRLEVKKYEELGSAPKPVALSVKGPNFQESHSVLPQVSGNVSPDITISSLPKQSPPSTKESKGKTNPSISDRLKGFFSPKKGSTKDKDRVDSEEPSVRTNDFKYSSVQLSAQKPSTEAVPRSPDEALVSPTEGAPRSSAGFEMGIRGAPQQGVPTPSSVMFSNGGQDGKTEQMDEEVEESWARSYSVNGGGVSATTNSARRALEFSSLGKGGVDEDATGTEDEDLVENRDALENDYDHPRKLYTIEREDEEGTAHRGHNGTGEGTPPGTGVPGFVFDGKDFNEFYYGMAFYGKDRVAADGAKEEAEDVEYEQKGYRVQPVGTEREERVNGVDGYATSEAQSTPPLQQQQQLSSDDDDEIISYTSNAQTTFPADDRSTQERIAEIHGKEKSDRETTAAVLPTSNRSDVFEFLDLNQFSLEPLELPSWESLGLSSQQNGGSSSYGSNATKYKTKEINLKTSEDQNNNALIDSSNA